MWMVVGLGNPGSRYEDTRHNVGFMAIDSISNKTGIATDRLQGNCAVGRGRVADAKVILVKPLTFMNVSGEGVIKLSKYYQIPPEHILVIYDDLDTPTASVRLRGKGGHGGHNGMRSLIQHLGTNEFPRLKVGIGRPSDGIPVVNHVLQNFSKEEREKIDVALREVEEAVRATLGLGIEKAVSGVRVDADGKPVPPKNSHQNGKGVKKPRAKQLKENTENISSGAGPENVQQQQQESVAVQAQHEGR